MYWFLFDMHIILFYTKTGEAVSIVPAKMVNGFAVFEVIFFMLFLTYLVLLLAYWADVISGKRLILFTVIF
jgi:hypothetical protein